MCDLHCLRTLAGEEFPLRQTASAPFSQRLIPVGYFAEFLKYLCRVRIWSQQAHPEIEGVLTCLMRQFVHKTFMGECQSRTGNRTPCCHRHMVIGPDIRCFDIGYLIVLFAYTF